VGRHEDRLRLTIDLFNERGPATNDDPEVRDLMREWVDPDIECVSYRMRLRRRDSGRCLHGIDGLARMVREFTAAWAELTAEVEDVDESEDSLVATVRYRGRGASSGAPIDEAYAWALRLRDGKPIRWVIDRDREAALRASGIAA
jgi:ketosteroid isomerase-like protein